MAMRGDQEGHQPQRCAVPCTLDIPTIETARLRLRGHGLADYQNCAALWGNAQVTRHIGGKPQTPEESWSRLLRYLGHWSLLGYGYWLIEERETGEFVGEVGISDYKRMMEPPLGCTPEVGWVLAPPKQGQGYATEVVRAVVHWGMAHFGQRELACLISPENLASIRVANKCGFTERYRTVYKNEATIVLMFDPLQAGSATR